MIASDAKTINVFSEDNKLLYDTKFPLVKIGGRGVGINKLAKEGKIDMNKEIKNLDDDD